MTRMAKKTKKLIKYSLLFPFILEHPVVKGDATSLKKEHFGTGNFKSRRAEINIFIKIAYETLAFISQDINRKFN